MQRNYLIVRVFLAILSLALLVSSAAHAETLRLITWENYVSKIHIKKFKEETGIDVELTLVSSENEIADKLRAEGGSKFDLVQPAQGHLVADQLEYGIYRPLDMFKIDQSLFDPHLLSVAMNNTTVDGEVYGVPYAWGVRGLVVNKKLAPDFDSFGDLCNEKYKGKTSLYLGRLVLIGLAYDAGEDPHAAYDNPEEYGRIMGNAADKLIECKSNIHTYYRNWKLLYKLMDSGKIVAGEAWDGTASRLNTENADINFVSPTTGALGWITTFALPAESKSDDAAYKWINFIMREENARRVSEWSGYKMAAKNFRTMMVKKAQKGIQEAFTDADIKRIKWFPPFPPELNDIEVKVLERVKAALGEQ